MNQEKMKTGPRRTFDWGRFAADYSALIAFVVLFVLAVIFRGFTFLNPTNLLNILRNNSIIGIISLGMTLIIIIGGIDLSVGSQLALSGLICLQVTNTTGNMFFGMLAGIAATIVFGILTGALIAHFNIPAFIVTLGTLTIYRSVAQYFFKGGGVLVSEEMRAPFTAISNSDFLGIPMPIIYWLILSVLVAIYVSRTATGRYIYAVGSNEKATRLSGINTNRVKVIVFAISALLVSLAAIVEASRLGSMNSASSGSSYEMDAIAAVVIGGTSMSGGRGTIVGTVFGTLTIGIINNMMNLLGVPPFLVGAVKGAIIIIAVLFQKRLDRER